MQGSLPAGGLRLCREGVEPSGSLRKVSVYIHPPFQDLHDAMKPISFSSRDIATPIRMPKERWDKDKNEYRRTGEQEQFEIL